MAIEPIILIKKKRSRQHGHSGGAWKVAYADFVTAMMALFIMLWLMNTSKPVQEAIAGYFRDPQGVAGKKGSAMSGGGERAAPTEEDMTRIKQQMLDSLGQLAGFEKLRSQIEITITPEGLRIEMMEDAKGTFFDNGNAEPTPILKDIPASSASGCSNGSSRTSPKRSPLKARTRPKK